MLSVLNRIMRVRVAVLLAALYSLTVLAPHVSLALAGPGGYVHCLTQEKSAQVVDSFHISESKHSHTSNDTAPDPGETQGPVAACCGLFAAAATVDETRVALPEPIFATKYSQLPPSSFIGQGPGRMIRPPIA